MSSELVFFEAAIEDLGTLVISLNGGAITWSRFNVIGTVRNNNKLQIQFKKYILYHLEKPP